MNYWQKKFQLKGKDTQEPFPLTGILPGLLSDPSPPNLVIWAAKAGEHINGIQIRCPTICKNVDVYQGLFYAAMYKPGQF